MQKNLQFNEETAKENAIGENQKGTAGRGRGPGRQRMRHDNLRHLNLWHTQRIFKAIFRKRKKNYKAKDNLRDLK